MTQHGYQRLSRLDRSGVSEEIQYNLSNRLEKFAAQCSCDTAVRVFVLSKKVVTQGTSNGEEIWAIIRNCNVITVMNRRSTQPKTTISLKVSKVVTMLP